MPELGGWGGELAFEGAVEGCFGTVADCGCDLRDTVVGCLQTMEAFRAWDKLALADGAIPKKYKELMAIAVALTTQCPYCIEVHRKQAVEAGATEAELAETVHVAAALRAGGALTHGTHLFEG